MFQCLKLVSVLLATVALSPDVQSIVSRFEARYRSAKTLQTTFLERYVENGHVVRVEAGTAYFRRPGKMRWEYESPEKNLFLVDGKAAWFYVPADRTVTRVPAKESTDWRTPLALLAGEARLSRVCEQIRVAPDEKAESPDNVVLLCTIRGAKPEKEKLSNSSPSMKTDETAGSVVFEVVKGTGELVRLVVRDPGGVTVEFHFANWVTNPELNDSFFHFTVPGNVAIVNGELR
jgi:outer membrane lipoprotein carrier protein